MSHMSKVVLLIGALCVVPAAANAGWIAEWEHTSIDTKGERGATESATQRIEKGKVRLVQPTMTSVIDYNESRFTILNPEHQYFWTGTVDQYVAEMLKTRAKAARRRRGGEVEPQAEPKLDPKSLPPVEIKRTDETETIAGHPTHKYEIRVNNEPFEELWLAEDLDLSSDLDPKKFLAYQKKMSAAMLGNSAASYNALYHSPEYQKLLQKGFILQSITHHIAGGFERKAVALKRAEIPDGEFEVPDSYRKVRLTDVFSAGKTS